MMPLGFVVGRVARRRLCQPAEYSADVPVICVGNPTVGGAGKTPLVMAFLKALHEAGHTPVALLRGYRGNLVGPVWVNPDQHTARDVGDEALLLAAIAPTVVARDRARGGALAQTRGDVIVMDDGFQNPGLKKDLALLVLDGAVGLGNGLVTPAGPLRAPITPQLNLAHGLVVVGQAQSAIPEGPTRYTATPRPFASEPLSGRALFVFAGVGRPQKVFESASAMGATVADSRGFADHHAYTEGDAKDLLASADAAGLALATTRKDHVRLICGGPACHTLAARCIVLDVAMEPDAALLALVLETAATTRQRRPLADAS